MVSIPPDPAARSVSGAAEVGRPEGSRVPRTGRGRVVRPAV